MCGEATAPITDGVCSDAFSLANSGKMLALKKKK